MKEFKLNVEKDEKLKSQIKIAAYHLSKEEFPYDVLCWDLAEFQLITEKGHGKYSEQDVIKRAEEIFDSSPKYDELCWLISEFKIYLIQENLYP